MKKILLSLVALTIAMGANATTYVTQPNGDANINITETRIDRMPGYMQQEYMNQQTQKARDERFNQLFSDPDDTKLEQDWESKTHHAKKPHVQAKSKTQDSH